MKAKNKIGTPDLKTFGIFSDKKKESLNCHIFEKVRAFDQIPKLRTRPEYMLSSSAKCPQVLQL